MWTLVFARRIWKPALFASVLVTLGSGQGTVNVSASPNASGSVPVVVVLPTVYIDGPAPGSVVSQNVVVSGWAIDNATAVGSAIGNVQVFVDGNSAGSATYGISRPDVCTVYAGRPGCPNVGFSYQLNTTALSPGQHTISVSATDTDGTPDTGTANVTVTVTAVPPTVHIDAPVGGSVLSGTATISGWALDNSVVVGTAISSVQVKVDGISVGNATYGASRPDVCSAYPGRSGCPNVGFAFPLSLSGLSPGSHTISVSATDTDGTPDVGSDNVSITVESGVPPSVYIDTPTPGAVVSGAVTVSGWALDNTGTATTINTVQVKIDGEVVGTAIYGISRPDVCTVYLGRPPGCPNVGFTYTLNTATLSPGSHLLTVSATDNDTSPDAGTWNTTIQVAAPPSVHIDSPANGATVSGIVTVAGWAIDSVSAVGRAISRVHVKVDGVVVGTATCGTNRPDVYTAFGRSRGCPNVGYTYQLNTIGLSPGAHILTVTATDSDGNRDPGFSSITIIR